MRRHIFGLILAIVASIMMPMDTFGRGGGGGGGGGGGRGGGGGGGGGGYRGGGGGNVGGTFRGNVGVPGGAGVRAGGNVGGSVRGNAAVPGGAGVRAGSNVGGAARVNPGTVAGGRTTNFRGNMNLNASRNNSVFFGNRAAFGGNRANFNGRWNNYGGYGWYGPGWGGYGGYGGFGLGYGYRGGFGFLPFFGLGGYSGYGYGGYGGGYGGYGGGYGGSGYATDDYAIPPVDAGAPPPTQAAFDYVTQGENDFRAARYHDAVSDFRHALIDEPNNAGIVMLLAQALFQTGQYTAAAGATEMAMGALPEDKWGVVVESYTKLYGNIQDYTNQLKSLELASIQKPDDPAMRFLLGFHYGYLGYPKQAVRELDKAVELEGRDPAARKLHDVFAAKIGAPAVGPAPKSEPAAGPPPDGTQPAAPPAAVVPEGVS